MKLFRSLKLIYIFVFLCFSTSFAIEQTYNLPNIDLISGINRELAKYLIEAKDSEGQLIHEGVASFFGQMELISLLSNPVNSLADLQARQAILKELVSLSDIEFNELLESFKTLVPDLDSLFKLAIEIKNEEQRLAFLKENMFKFFGGNGQANGVMKSAVYYASNALTLIMTKSRVEALLAASGGVGVPFVTSLLISIFLGAVYEYVMRASISNLIPWAILKDQVLPGTTGPDRFLCGDILEVPTTEAAIKKLAESSECKKIVNPGSYFGSLIPGFVKTATSMVMDRVTAIGNLPGISYVSSSMPWINSSMFLGGGLIDLFRIDRLIFYIKDSYKLTEKKGKIEALELQLRGKHDELFKKIKRLNISLGSEDLGKLDVYFGLVSLIRESLKQESECTKFKFGFVEFMETDHSENRFEMNIKNSCYFLKFKPDNVYKTMNKYSEKYIFPELNISVSKDNQILINSNNWQQAKFLDAIKPLYSQMLLAHTFGIVWGQSAKMKFVNMNDIRFVSNSEQIVDQIVFPEA